MNYFALDVTRRYDLAVIHWSFTGYGNHGIRTPVNVQVFLPIFIDLEPSRVARFSPDGKKQICIMETPDVPSFLQNVLTHGYRVVAYPSPSSDAMLGGDLKFLKLVETNLESSLYDRTHTLFISAKDIK